jgi:hypothetical protein
MRLIQIFKSCALGKVFRTAFVFFYAGIVTRVNAKAFAEPNDCGCQVDSGFHFILRHWTPVVSQ